MELEALEAIYADAFTMTSENPLEWRVHLEPSEGGAGDVNHGKKISWAIFMIHGWVVMLLALL